VFECVLDRDDPRLEVYTRLKDVSLRRLIEPEWGLFMAESTEVIGRALDAGIRPRSLLLAEEVLPTMTALTSRIDSAIPIYVGTYDLLRSITGFHLHRGVLAAMTRPASLDVETVLLGAAGNRTGAAMGAGSHGEAMGVHRSGAESASQGLPAMGEAGAQAGSASSAGGRPVRRVVVLEDIVDHTNVGAIIRAAAGLGVDGVLVTPRCADPLYRRAVRVSMGTVFQVPWTRIDPWPGGMARLRAAGFTVAAMALRPDAVPLDEFVNRGLPAKLALLLGTEGVGLRAPSVDAADVVLRIPMSGGVDSLNVAAAAAVALWATRP
jgi:tRNA G18 (ribose-2'-O)-methylase SpoU